MSDKMAYGVEVSLHSFLTSPLGEGDTHCLGRWVDPRACLDPVDSESLSPAGNRPRFRPVTGHYID